MRSPVESASLARFGRMKKRLSRLNPDIDVESVLDPQLDYDENINLLKKSYPSAVITDRQNQRDDEDEGDENMQAYREGMADEYSISNRKLQDLIAGTQPPLSTEEANTLQFLTGGGRSLRAVAIDKAKQARKVNDARDYVHNFNRGDVATLDDKPKNYKPLYKLKKENRSEWKKRVEENKRNYEQSGMV